jgi:hypothetical protein
VNRTQDALKVLRGKARQYGLGGLADSELLTYGTELDRVLASAPIGSADFTVARGERDAVAAEQKHREELRSGPLEDFSW